MAEVKGRTSTRKPAPSRGQEIVIEEATESGRPVCSFVFCPICMALTAIGEARPELVEHVLAASREMLLALRELIDTRLEGSAGQQHTKLERLTIE
jgi:hypothetical protein